MRKIIHIDMDCFYAAVEMRDNPKYKSIPLAIGGKVTSRGVIATANYEARKFGVHSAMSSAMAMKKCPQLTLISGNMAKYKEASDIIKNIFYKYTNLVEPLSLDEAYLDVTNSQQYSNSATLIAIQIRKEIFEKTQLTASAGIAPNKFLAKVASDWNKPNGQKVISPNQVDEFVKYLDVTLISGVGKVTAKKLHHLNIRKCIDVQKRGAEFMKFHFNKFGAYLYNLSCGIDEREIVTNSPRKSLSVEETFEKDIDCFDQWTLCSSKLIEELIRRLKVYKEKKNPTVYIDKIIIKLKYFDFKQVTIQKKSDADLMRDIWVHHTVTEELTKFITSILRQGYDKRSDPIRLIGIGVGFKEIGSANTHQLELL